MKLTETLQTVKPLKKFTNYKSRPIFKQMISPMELRDKVSSRGDRVKEKVCLQEMSTMLACLERHEFSEALCTREIGAFWQCQTAAQATKNAKLEAEAKGVLTKMAGKYPNKYVNELLQKFPEPKKSR